MIHNDFMISYTQVKKINPTITVININNINKFSNLHVESFNERIATWFMIVLKF